VVATLRNPTPQRYVPRYRERRLTRRQRAAAIVLAVLAAGFITLDVGGSSLQSAHSGVRGFFGSLYRGTDSVIGPVRRWVQGLPSAGTNEARVDALRADKAELEGRLTAAAADARTAQQLKDLGLVSTLGTVVPARVVALGPGQGFDWTVTLDRGTKAGIAAGQTVTDGHGLVGRVLRADKDSCVVLLAADPGSGVGARVVRGGEIGIATGAGSDGFTFRPLNPDAKLKVGDTLTTGPSQDSSFVAGLTIGTITGVTSSADGTTTASVRPAAPATSLDLLGVLTEPT